MKKRYTCPCCGYKTLGELPRRSYEICPVCFWEDDPYQFEFPDAEGFANEVSLRQAQKNFVQFGASDRDRLKYTRKPDKYEKDSQWRPV